MAFLAFPMKSAKRIPEAREDPQENKEDAGSWHLGQCALNGKCEGVGMKYQWHLQQ